MRRVDTAVLLAAGEGSRLRGAAAVKPLCPVAGRPLIDHALHGLAEAGIARAVVVLGYGGAAIAAHLAAHDWPLVVETVTTPDHRQPNGVSVLAAGPRIENEALLAMCDHLVVPALYGRLADAGAGAGCRLGIDRRLDSGWIDLDDVTCVRTDGSRIVAIGKGLAQYDCYDTGVFAVGRPLFDALERCEAPSLTEGVRALAAEGKAHIVDCTGLEWIDVDEPGMLAEAEAWMTGQNAMRRSA